MKTILVSAYGCEPGKGSEQGVGWNWALRLAGFQNVWVITRKKNRAIIEKSLPEDVGARLHFVYYDLPDWIKKHKRGAKGLYWYYILWQYGVYQLARRLSRQNHFDYCMHLTFGNIWLPTWFHKLGIPFIWGPLGGAGCIPFRFLREFPVSARIPQIFRNLFLSHVGYIPWVHGPLKRAVAVIVRTEKMKSSIPARYRDKVFVRLETAIDISALEAGVKDQPVREPGKIRLVYTGRFVPFKNLSVLFRALTTLGDLTQNMTLELIGEGSMEKRYRKELKRLGIEDRVIFDGELSRAETLSAVRNCDIFVFPSLREEGSWSLMEAMALSLPVICLDAAGVNQITGSDTAIRIPMTTVKGVEFGLAQGIRQLTQSASLRKALGGNGREKIRRDFNWDNIERFIRALFDDLDGEQQV